MKKITSRQLQKVLHECHINPNVPGPYKVIVDSSNVEYLIRRADEILQNILQNTPMYCVQNKIKDAITLLAVAVCVDINITDAES